MNANTSACESLALSCNQADSLVELQSAQHTIGITEVVLLIMLLTVPTELKFSQMEAASVVQVLTLQLATLLVLTGITILPVQLARIVSQNMV